MSTRAQAGPALPAATLVVSTRNRPQLVRDAIDSIPRGCELSAELIVVDQSDGPDPGPNCRLRYEWMAEPGVSRARNLGIARASHELLAFVDDDALVSPDWYGNLLRALARAGPPHVTAGSVREAAQEIPDGFVLGVKADGRAEVYDRPGRYDMLWTGNMAAYRESFVRFGPFDERLGPGTPFPAAEDHDFDYRLLRGGGRIRYEPTAVVLHRGWRSRAQFLALHWSYGLGQGALYAKHLRALDPYPLGRIWRDAWQRLIRVPRRLLRDRPQLAADWAFMAAVLVGGARWIARHRGRR